MAGERFSIDTKNNPAVAMGEYSFSPISNNFCWVAAIDAWDYCNPTPLSEMILNHPIPVELRHVLASIASGERKQNKRGAAKLKIDADQRMLIAASFLSLLVIPKAVLSGRTHIKYSDVADREGVEPIELRRKYDAYVRKMYSKIAASAGISVESLENLVRDLREKANRYPNI